MANVIKLHKGLNINVAGKAAPEVKAVKDSAIIGIVPDAFTGVTPLVKVKEGTMVKAGDALFVDKLHPEVVFASPVSGKVVTVERGDRRKVLSIQVEADEEQQYVDFGQGIPASKDEVKQALLKSGLFAFFIQRPYAVTCNPDDDPKAIFVSGFSDMPLAADFEVVYKGQERDFQTGIDALGKLAKVYLGIKLTSALRNVKNAEITVFEGKCPAGNVGVQINHISPVNKGEVVWTIGAEEVIFIGRLFNTGKLNLTRTIAVAGPEVKDPCYVQVVVGAKIGKVVAEKVNDNAVIIDGNPLTGREVTVDDFLGAHTTEVTAIANGSEADEAFGWILPRFNQFSVSRSYFSWLQGNKAFKFDNRIKGGHRHMIMSGEYDKVFPMDIFPEQLVKAIIAGDIDRMEALGIYEVAPEDFALCEFVDSSKVEVQRVVREGLDMLRKENS